jgi:hypothetical protein
MSLSSLKIMKKSSKYDNLFAWYTNMNDIENKITVKYPYSIGIEKGVKSHCRDPNGIWKRQY